MSKKKKRKQIRNLYQQNLTSKEEFLNKLLDDEPEIDLDKTVEITFTYKGKEEEPNVKEPLTKQSDILPEKSIIKQSKVMEITDDPDNEESVLHAIFNETKIETKVPKKKKTLVLMSVFIPVIFIIGLLFIIQTEATKNDVKFSLNGKEEIDIPVFEEYKEAGAKLLVNEIDNTSKIIISGEVDTEKVGVYEIKYTYLGEDLGIRTVNVIDDIAPVVALNGDETIKIFVGANFTDPGITATDNYDKQLTIETDGEVNKDVVGEYKLTYRVLDSSRNLTTIERTIQVVEIPKVIETKLAPVQNDPKPKPPVVTVTNNKAKSILLIDGVIRLEGCTTNEEPPVTILLNEKEIPTTINNSCYSANLPANTLEHGDYEIFIKTTNEKFPIYNNFALDYQIKKVKLGNVQLDFNYNNNITFKISGGYYSSEYDVIIDVGHGGSDTGAANNFLVERDMNLIVSNYEKKLFEDAGYKVKLSRESNDTYGNLDGDGSWSILRRRAYYVGKLGVNAKVVYSNHHNAAANSNAKGFQLYLPTQMRGTAENRIYEQVGAIFRTSGYYKRTWNPDQFLSAYNYYNRENYYTMRSEERRVGKEC